MPNNRRRTCTPAFVRRRRFANTSSDIVTSKARSALLQWRTLDRVSECLFFVADLAQIAQTDLIAVPPLQRNTAPAIGLRSWPINGERHCLMESPKNGDVWGCHHALR